MKLTRLFKNPILEPRIKLEELHNPHISPEALTYWWELRSTCNPGVILKDDKFYILYRAQDFHFISRFGLAIFDPKTNKIIDRSDFPVFEFTFSDEIQFGRIGCEDPRIVYWRKENKYFITCVSATIKAITPVNLELIKKNIQYSWYDVYTKLLTTNDFKTFTDEKFLFKKKLMKDVTIFPQKIGESYMCLLRTFPSIQLVYSRNLDTIENSIELIKPRSGYWDSHYVGIGATPLFTPQGWICIYHGVDEKMTYRLGYFLLDLNDPTKILYRSKDPILEPETEWEKVGNVPNVVFSNGADRYEDKIYVFYGAADRCVGVSYAKISDFFNFR